MALTGELRLLWVTATVMTPCAGEAAVAASEKQMQSIAKSQFDLGEGPSYEAFTSGRPVLIPDLAASDGRWPGFTPVALAAGVGGVAHLPSPDAHDPSPHELDAQANIRLYAPSG